MDQRKITEYIIAASKESEELDYKVCQFIESGWQPYGDLQVNGEWLYQPLVKYEESDTT